MTDKTSGLDAIYQDPWIQAELSYIKQIIHYLFDEEAAISPIIAPALDNMKAASGKMLRPLLVLLGARTAGGSSYDYGQLPPPPDKAAAMPARSSLDRRARKFVDQLKRQGWSKKDNQELKAWKAEAAFPGGLPNRIYLLAAALEILHLATLVHDDVVDESPLRRNRPAAWQSVGNNHAVLLGDLLLSLCFALVSEGSDILTGQLLSGMVRYMVRSEFMQASDRENLASVLDQPSRRRYGRVIGGKTALLFSLALSAGAHEMQAKEACIQSLRRGGYFLGLAFQVEDDMLDYLADQQDFGKPSGQDLRDGQISLPVIEALSNRKPGIQSVKQELIANILAFHRGDEALFQTIVQQIDQLGGFEAADRLSHHYLGRAGRDLDAIAASQAVPAVAKHFRSLMSFLARRHY